MDALLAALDAHIAHLTALRDGLRRTRTTRYLPMALHAAQMLGEGVDTLATSCGVRRRAGR